MVVRVARDEWKEVTVHSHVEKGKLNFKYTDKDNAGKGGSGCVAKFLVRRPFVRLYFKSAIFRQFFSILAGD